MSCISPSTTVVSTNVPTAMTKVKILRDSRQHEGGPRAEWHSACKPACGYRADEDDEHQRRLQLHLGTDTRFRGLLQTEVSFPALTGAWAYPSALLALAFVSSTITIVKFVIRAADEPGRIYTIICTSLMSTTHISMVAAVYECNSDVRPNRYRDAQRMYLCVQSSMIE